MQVDLNSQELNLLAALVDTRIRDLHPEIRRSRVSTYTDELKHSLEDMEKLLDKLEVAGGHPPSP